MTQDSRKKNTSRICRGCATPSLENIEESCVLAKFYTIEKPVIRLLTV